MDTPEMTVGDIIDGLTERQKKCLYYYINVAHRRGVNALDLERSCTTGLAGLDRQARHRMAAVSSLTVGQFDVFRGLIEEVCEEYHKNEQALQ